MKKYSVIINKNSFIVQAINIISAKDIAQFNKRMCKYKGKTFVKLLK